MLIACGSELSQVNNESSLPTAEVIETAVKQAEIQSFTTEGKPTKTIETPWGPREVYDPMQDSEVKQAFRQIMKIKQEANYFNDWPEDILDRVQIHTHITHINRNKVDLNLPAKFEAIERKSPEIRDYLSIVLIAKTAQSLDYTRSNCEHINNLQCGKSVDWLSFEAKCET